MSDEWVNVNFCYERYKAVNDRMDLCIANVKTRIEGMDKALELKTEEMERRLEGLNQLRAEVTKDRDLYVPKVAYDLKVTMYDAFVSDTTKLVTKLATQYENRITAATILSVFSMLIALVSVIMAWLLHK